MAQRTDLTLPNTDCTCTVCLWHFERARSEIKTQSGVIISNTEPLLWTLDHVHPCHPIPVGQRAEMITCLCFVWTLSPFPAAPLRSRDVPEKARSLDSRSSFPKRKYSPESDSANNSCNTSSQYNFLLVIWRFSLTIYSHAMTWTASASMTRSLTCSAISSNTLNRNMTSFWSRTEVLHVCHLVVGNTNAILHHIRNYSLFNELWHLVAILRLWRLEGLLSCLCK